MTTHQDTQKESTKTPAISDGTGKTLQYKTTPVDRGRVRAKINQSSTAALEQFGTFAGIGFGSKNA